MLRVPRPNRLVAVLVPACVVAVLAFGALTARTTEAAPGARMTGAGRIEATDISYAFELYCDPAAGRLNNLQVKWGKGNTFHLEAVPFLKCSDYRHAEPEPPAATFDRIDGLGTGRLNGVPGATVRFTFVDDGEPGRGDHDYASMWITDADGTVVFNLGGYLVGGNHQAHH